MARIGAVGAVAVVGPAPDEGVSITPGSFKTCESGALTLAQPDKISMLSKLNWHKLNLKARSPSRLALMGHDFTCIMLNLNKKTLE
jgi:hypothetical protein